MSNKDIFITKCLELLKEKELSKKEAIVLEILNTFSHSEMIFNTPDELKINSLVDMKEILKNYILKNEGITDNDVNQMCFFQSQLIGN